MKLTGVKSRSSRILLEARAVSLNQAREYPRKDAARMACKYGQEHLPPLLALLSNYSINLRAIASAGVKRRRRLVSSNQRQPLLNDDDWMASPYQVDQLAERAARDGNLRLPPLLAEELNDIGDAIALLLESFHGRTKHKLVLKPKRGRPFKASTGTRNAIRAYEHDAAAKEDPTRRFKGAYDSAAAERLGVSQSSVRAARVARVRRGRSAAKNSTQD